MKLPRGTKIFLRGCEEGSPAYKLGIRLGDVGWVCDLWGHQCCCYDPSECSTVTFFNDAGYQLFLCVQDVHMERVREQ
jgi:hypothetical protein